MFKKSPGCADDLPFTIGAFFGLHKNPPSSTGAPHRSPWPKEEAAKVKRSARDGRRAEVANSGKGRIRGSEDWEKNGESLY